MTYNEKLEQAKKNGTAKDVTVPLHLFENPGVSLVGKLIKIESVPSKKYDSSQNLYYFETDGGMVKTFLSSGTDKMICAEELIGKVLWIVYKGKDDIGDGKTLKRFEISEI